MKILYAAGNSLDSKLNLERIIENLHKKYDIKVAAYKKSTPNPLSNVKVSFTLDFLLGNKKNVFYTDTDAYSLYYEQVKSFAPDLIISDIEYFTSSIGMDLDIPVWQVSPFLLKDAFPRHPFKMNIYAKHFNINKSFHETLNNMIANSNKLFVYSHLADIDYKKNAETTFTNAKFIRPYFKIGNDSKLCKHNLMCVLENNNKLIINNIKNNKDVMLFSEFSNEKYYNFTSKDIRNEKEYYCNLKNCDFFICEGQSVCLADAFYNNKFVFNYVNYNDANSIINSLLGEKFNLSKTLLPLINFDKKISDFIKYSKESLTLKNLIESVRLIEEKEYFGNL